MIPSMLDEIEQRCLFLELPKRPKPKNWNSPVMRGWLEKHPIKNTRCVRFIKSEELQLRKALIEARKETESSTSPALAWRSNEPWLCLYHCLIEDEVKKAFVICNQLMDKDELDASKNHPNVPNPGQLYLRRRSTAPHSL